MNILTIYVNWEAPTINDLLGKKMENLDTWEGPTWVGMGGIAGGSKIQLDSCEQ